MSLQIGDRVTVLANVSNRMDKGSIQNCGPEGANRKYLVGRKGEILAISEDGKYFYVCDQHATLMEWLEADEIRAG